MENQYIEIERKYESLINMAIEKMKCLNDPKHSLVHVFFVGINRWKECIKKDCKFHKMLELLPTTRKDILKLEVSKEIYDREIGKLVVFLHDNIFNNKCIK